MDVLIGKQAAIDALGTDEDHLIFDPNDEYEVGLRNQWEWDVGAIKKLPPAQPEMTNREWIIRHLSDMDIADAICNKVRCETCPLALPKDECRKWDEDELEKWMDEGCGECAISPVTPEPKRGKWIHVSEEMWKCDQCGELSCCSPNFCPDCGADMRERRAKDGQ